MVTGLFLTAKSCQYGAAPRAQTPAPVLARHPAMETREIFFYRITMHCFAAFLFPAFTFKCIYFNE
jgi:hypothetical protein